jgi:hypothetical protein
MGYPWCFGNMLGLARAREIDNSATMKTVSSTREAFMMHLLDERGEHDNALAGVDPARAQKRNAGRGTEARTAMEPITPVSYCTSGTTFSIAPD